MLTSAEQRGETGIRIEAWRAQPIDRTVASDQRRGARVPDQRVVFDGGCHFCSRRGRLAIDSLGCAALSSFLKIGAKLYHRSRKRPVLTGLNPAASIRAGSRTGRSPQNRQRPWRWVGPAGLEPATKGL